MSPGPPPDDRGGADGPASSGALVDVDLQCAYTQPGRYVAACETDPGQASLTDMAAKHAGVLPAAEVAAALAAMTGD
jgi:hypothetical protein